MSDPNPSFLYGFGSGKIRFYLEPDSSHEILGTWYRLFVVKQLLYHMHIYINSCLYNIGNVMHRESSRSVRAAATGRVRQSASSSSGSAGSRANRSRQGSRGTTPLTQSMQGNRAVRFLVGISSRLSVNWMNSWQFQLFTR